MLECGKENHDLRRGSMELYSRKGLLGVYQSLTISSIRNEKTCKYININNIHLVCS